VDVSTANGDDFVYEKKKVRGSTSYTKGDTGGEETRNNEEPDHVAEPRPGRPAKLAARPPVAVTLQPARCIATSASARLPGGSRCGGLGWER
jgi:hypothetical protein